MSTNPRRIDLHHHVLPPDFVAELGRRNIDWTGGAGVPPWSVDSALETMARHGIAAAVASPQPQVFWGDTGPSVEWARHSNEYLARIVHDDPEHFGGFATMPLPDAGAACRELEYAYDVLGLDGVFMMTSYGTQYPGDPAFEEFFAELNRRRAVVCIHPNTTPPGSNVPTLALPYMMVEFVFDTTRCVASLLYSGTLERYPDIRFILPHAGGTVPYLAHRIAIGEQFPRFRERVPQGVLHYLRRLYYDTAISTADVPLAALQTFVPTSQIVFGSDYPFMRGPLLDAEVVGLDTSAAIDEAARRAIDRDNALALFPRLAGESLVPAPLEAAAAAR